MAANISQLRSLYRSILRELPHRPLSSPSPIQQRIRTSFSTNSVTTEQISKELAAAKQYVTYAKSQSLYATLLERYNPGMSMDEEERNRLTVRRVGMNMPTEWKPEEK